MEQKSNLNCQNQDHVPHHKGNQESIQVDQKLYEEKR